MLANKITIIPLFESFNHFTPLRKMRTLTVVSVISLLSINFTALAEANSNTIENLTIEELRIKKALKEMPEVTTRFSSLLQNFSKSLENSKNIEATQTCVIDYAQRLWQQAVQAYQNHKDFDDRPLYWARLQLAVTLRQSSTFKKLAAAKQELLIWQLELASRGQMDIEFEQKTDLKLLLTGFDPFFLDRNLDQSNPSGVVATAFDNKTIKFNGKSMEIETVIVPVRFADFDQGMIEEMLTPFIKDKKVDMIATVSMGRDNFDLERFPGKRRSAKAPDNLNVLTGANEKNPIIPLLNGQPIEGPEFVLFSLPVDQMKIASGNFEIKDNHKVTTIEKTFEPKFLDELQGKISVQGSGGGYLSNEISYRSILLRNKYHSTLPVGHIHTPRFQGFKPKKIEKILEQVEKMLKQAMTTL